MQTLTSTHRRAVQPNRLKADTERIFREAEDQLSKLAGELPEGDMNAAMAIETLRNLSFIRHHLGSKGVK